MDRHDMTAAAEAVRQIVSHALDSTPLEALAREVVADDRNAQTASQNPPALGGRALRRDDDVRIVSVLKRSGPIRRDHDRSSDRTTHGRLRR
jgi:hypothetical protein